MPRSEKTSKYGAMDTHKKSRKSKPARKSHENKEEKGHQHQNQNSSSSKLATNSRLMKYLDDYRSETDMKALKSEGYEIDYDRLVGIGTSSAVFLAHPLNVPAPQNDSSNSAGAGTSPLYVFGYHIAVKIISKKHIKSTRPSKTRTGNLKLALALGQTKAEHNILRVIDVFKTPDRIFVFMHYCAYGNLISFMRRNGSIPERLGRKWSQQVASALIFIHKFHIAHRNYKLENVLVNDQLDAKLTGFGLSKFCVDMRTKQTLPSRTICGSEPYLAPEMLIEAHERLYDPKQADVWAFGVGIYLCITRRYPFEADTLKGLKTEQLAGQYLARDTKNRLTQPAKELIVAIFNTNPAKRPSMQELYDKFAWLNGGKSAETSNNQDTLLKSVIPISYPHNAALPEGSSSLSKHKQQK